MSTDTAASAPTSATAPRLAEAINRFCPRSGKAIVATSLTRYRGVVVGFCNTHCRDDFAAHVQQRPLDTRYFDALISEHELAAEDCD